MKKISFRNVLTQCGVGMLVIFLAFIGSFLIREARSFIDPGSGPGAPGVLGPDVGVIGNPTEDGIPGAPTLFQGQKAIKTAIDGIGGGGVLSFAGYTSSAFNGNLGMLKGANDKCEASYSGSHWASYDEIMRLGAQYPWTQNAWVRDALDHSIRSQDGSTLTYHYKDGLYVFGVTSYHCGGWSDSLNSSYGPVITDGSSVYLNERYTINPRACNLMFALPCVY